MAAITNSTNPYAPHIHQTPFPGIGATFVHEAGDWKLYDGGAPLVRSLNLISATQGSFFETLHICGYRNGSIVFHIKFKKDLEKSARTYFKNLDVDDVICVARAKTSQQRTVLFTVLTRHNTLPPEHHELIRKLSHAENWFDVTPLRPGEKLACGNQGPTLDNIHDLAHAAGMTFDKARSCLTQPKKA